MQFPPLHRRGVLSDEATLPARAPARTRGGGPGRWVFRGLLILLGLVAVTLLGGYAYLRSEGGRAWVRTKVEDALTALPGKLTFQSLSVSLREVELRGVELRTPEGETVATVDRAYAALRLSPLLWGRVEVAELSLEAPHLLLAQDARGLNLQRALVKASPDALPEVRRKGQPPPLHVSVNALTVRDGVVRFTPADGDPVELDALELRGRGRYSLRSGRFAGEVAAEAQSNGPVEAPLQLKASVRGGPQALAGQVDAALGEAKVRARAQTHGTEEVRVELERLVAPPELLRTVVDGYPLIVPVQLSGVLLREGNEIRLDAAAQAASAQAKVQGRLDLAQWKSEGMHVQVENVNLRELVKGARPSDLSLELHARGQGTSLENLNASLSLRVPKSELGGESLGPVTAELRARDGAVQVEKLQGAFPGLSVSAQGSAGLERLQLSGQLQAKDLSRTFRALEGMRLFEPPALSGNGEFAFTLRGSPKHPALTADGSFESLQVATVRAQGLAVKARVPDLTRPLEAQALLSSQRLSLGERAFEEVRADLTTRGRNFTAELTSKGLESIQLRLGGTLDPDSQGIQLATFSLRYPEARWTLQRPFHLSWGEAGVAVSPALTLQSGGQSLQLRGALRGERVQGALEVRGLDLQQLPSAFLPGDLGLRGTVDLQAKVNGTLPEPAAELEVDWQHGAGWKVRDLSVHLSAAHERGTVEGSLRAATPFAKVSSDFALPTDPSARRPWDVQLWVENLRAGAALTALELPRTVEGTWDLTGRLEGTLDAPKVRLRAVGKSVQWIPEGASAPKLSIPSVTAELFEDSGGAVAARVEAQALDGEAWLRVESPFTPAELLRAPPNEAALRRGRWNLASNFEGLALSQLAFLQEGLSGTLSGVAYVDGTLEAPKGTVTLRGQGLKWAGLTPTDLEAELRAQDDALVASARAWRAGAQVLELDATLGTSVGEALARSAALETARLQGDLKLGPVPLAELQKLSEEPPVQSVTGAVQATAELRGTLRDPRLQLKASLFNARFDDRALGEANVTYSYKAGLHLARVDFDSPSRGSLKARGELRLDVSLPALRKGLPLAQAPVKGTLNARQFELAFLSGLVPNVRVLGGTLEASASAEGVLFAPNARGQLEWKHGRVALLGMGEYEDIHLAATASQDRVDLRELRATSGRGTLRITGNGVRSGEHFAVSATGDAKDFPVVVDDQLLATVSLRMGAKGTASPKGVRLAADVPEAHLTLPQARRRDLQSLERPEDIVLVRRGEPVNPRKRRAPPTNGGAVQPATYRPTRVSDSESFLVVLTLDAPRNLWLRSSDIEAEFGLSDDFRVEVGEVTQVFGEVQVIRGRAELLGKRFDLARNSSVRFSGPPTLPWLNVTAEHEVRSEDVTITVSIRGQGKNVRLQTSSNPPLPESEIYTLLATGKRTLERGSGSSMTGAQAAASVLGGLLAAQLKNAVAANLPLDVVSIEAGDQGLTGARLEVGKYVSDRLYLGFSGRLGVADVRANENSYAGRLEYQLSPRWSLEAAAGDVRTEMDLVWSRDF